MDWLFSDLRHSGCCTLFIIMTAAWWRILESKILSPKLPLIEKFSSWGAYLVLSIHIMFCPPFLVPNVLHPLKPVDSSFKFLMSPVCFSADDVERCINSLKCSSTMVAWDSHAIFKKAAQALNLKQRDITEMIESEGFNALPHMLMLLTPFSTFVTLLPFHFGK